jgi:hypothetical protein
LKQKGKAALVALPFVILVYKKTGCLLSELHLNNAIDQLVDLLFCMSRVGYINMNNLSFIYVNKKRKNILPSVLKDAIFISVATSYLVSDKQIKKTY